MICLESKTIQVLFSGGTNYGHWICIYYRNSTIHVFDSLNKLTLDMNHKIFLNRMFPNKNNIRIIFETVSQQINGYDCGVFAIAFATSLAFNICPCTLKYNILQLRAHLCNMLRAGRLLQFPITFMHPARLKTVRGNLRHLREQIGRIFALEFSNINFTVVENANAIRYSQQMSSLTRTSTIGTKSQPIIVDNVIDIQRASCKRKVVSIPVVSSVIGDHHAPIAKTPKLISALPSKLMRCNAKARKFLAHRAAITSLPFSDDMVAPHYLGSISLICEHCNAKHFAHETTANSKITNCCSEGKIVLPADHDFPVEILQLATDSKFLRNSRGYNNELALASFSAKLQTLPGKGPQVIRICGQIYHNTNTLHPTSPADSRYGQLYIIDNELATKIRMKNCRHNDHYSFRILELLDNLLRRINPYVSSYKMMHEVELAESKKYGSDYTSCNIRMLLTREPYCDKNRYNICNGNEVAIVFVGDDGAPPVPRDVCIYSRNGNVPTILNALNRHTDGMCYPLIHPRGGSGWTPDTKNLAKNHNKNISTLQFYKYKLQIRDTFSPYLNLGKITQQYVVDQWVKIKGSRLYYCRKNQAKLRTDMYNGVMDYLHNKSIVENKRIGKMVILPSSFGTGPRAMQQNFLDSMVLVQQFGRPDFFITFTCNGNWEEIVNNLRPGEQPTDRPDLTSRVFEGKLQSLIHDLTKRNILGKCIAFTYVAKFQKRGLPHAHLLLWVEKNDKPRNSNDVDSIVCAEIPCNLTTPTL